MKKKTYKRMQRRLMNETYKRMHEQNMRVNAQEDAKFYKERLFKLGSNVETVELEGCVECLKWDVEPKQYGNWCMTITDRNILSILPDVEDSLIKAIAKGLIERGIVQFIVKDGEYDPLMPYGTVGAKLYVVPWEQMPHKRKIELMQYAETERMSNG